MKAMVCEMCDSRDLIKQGEFYVCQNCGTKYTVEAAKKLMVEGTVKIDNTDVVEKYLLNARRAKKKEDWEETEKYYNMVEQNDPSNIEAIFYSAYGKAMTTLPVNDVYVRESVFKTLCNSASVLDENFDLAKAEEQLPMLEQIATDAIDMFGSEFVYTQYKNGYGVVTGDDKHKTYQLFINVLSNLCDSYSNIIKKLPGEAKKEKVCLYEQILRMLKRMASSEAVKKEGRERFLEFYQQFLAALKKVDPSYDTAKHEAFMESCREMIKASSRKGKAKILVGVAVGLLIGLAIVAYYYFTYARFWL